MTSVQGEANISVSRARLIDDVFEIYSDPTMPTKALHVHFKDESGDDLGGLTKDFITNAWKLILKEYFEGENAVVPFLPLHKRRDEKDKFVMIGRLLSHTAALLEIIPARLSRTTLLQIVFGDGDDCVGEELLLNDFLLYLSPTDRMLISRAVLDFDQLQPSQKEDLLTFYSIHSLHQIPSAAKCRDQILTIAQEVLIDRPRPLISKLKQGIPEIHTNLFWSLLTEAGISLLYHQQMPTPNKVVNCIKTESDDLRIDEESAMYFFKQYISTLDQEELSDLLLFITGSTCMPDDITISFRNVTGEGRCPIAHTCSNLLELPTSYSSVQDLKREFRAVLSSSHSYEMTML